MLFSRNTSLPFVYPIKTEVMASALNNTIADDNNYDDNFNESVYHDLGYVYTVHESFMNTLQGGTAIFGVILAAWTFCINVLVIYCCVKDKTTRCDAFYIQIVNFSLSNLIICAFIIPLTVYHILHPWHLGNIVCKIWIIFDVLLPFASITILLVLNIDRLLLMTHPNAYSCIFQICLKEIIVITPWLVAMVIVVPLWTSGTLPFNSPGECMVVISTDAAMTCTVMTYCIPLVIVIGLTLKILLLQSKSSSITRRDNYSMQVTESQSEQETRLNKSSSNANVIPVNPSKTASSESVTAMCLVNMFFLGMWFPYQCVTFILTVCSSQLCLPSVEVNQVVTWTGAASAGVAPLFWFVDKNIRTRLQSVCKSQTNSLHSENSVSRVSETVV